MYNGVFTQQLEAFEACFNELFNNFTPDIIIELGTARGGLTSYLATKCSKVYTYDNTLSQERDNLLSKTTVIAKVADIFSEAIFDEIKTLIQSSGPALLLCDNGDKIREVNLFSPVLKPGDVIMAHDYAHNGIFPAGWQWSEIAEKDVLDHNLVPFLQDVMKDAAWLSKRKQ